jgi:hypothetical protein
MSDLSNLDPNVRAWAMVGSFLQAWSYVEAQLNDLLGKALNLNSTQTFIVTSNLQFRDKIHIARTALNSSVSVSADERERLDKRLLAISDYSSKRRNMAAHHMFGPSKDKKGVTFLVVKAKGKLSLPDVTWSLKDLNVILETLAGFQTELREIQAKISNEALVRALMNPPKPGNFLQGLTGLLSHLPPDSQHSYLSASTPETDSQTPQAETE